MEAAKQTCMKLQVPTTITPTRTESVFIQGTFYPTRFTLSISNGQDSWVCEAGPDEVSERAAQWDQTLQEYIHSAHTYLASQQPDSVYAFSDAGKGTRRLSWTFEKEGTKLEWRWKCQPSPNSKKTTADILDFLLDANIRLNDEVVNKTQSFDRLKVEAEKCFAQSEKLSKEKEEFESEIYAKFVAVLNSKKAKLRELRDQLSQQGTGKKMIEVEEQSSDKTVSYDGESDEVKSDEELPENLVGTSKDVPARQTRGRKRK